MCKMPLHIRKESSDGWRTIAVPCGKCPKCVNARIASWTWRMEQELLHSYSPLFVTLTYNRQSVPVAEIDFQGVKKPFRVLRPKDLTNYIKLLRFHYGKVSSRSLRYFAVGEYGTKRKRPHYHLILLNCDDIRLIQDVWPYGFVDISPLRSSDAVGYCVSYLYKKQSFIPSGYPCFSRMSKGLGRQYINPEIVSYHTRDLANCHVKLQSGRTIPLPKYFKDKIYPDSQRYWLTHYLQEISDIRLDARVALVAHNAGISEEAARVWIYREPFIEKPEKCRVSID